MKKITFTMLEAVMLFSTAAQAQEQTIKGYASVKTVMTKTDGSFWGDKKKFDPKGINIAVGVKTNKNLRLEAEYNYRESADKTEHYFETNGVDYIYEGTFSTELSIQSYMLNGYYDFHNTTKFTPYVGIGFGMAKIEYDDFGAYDEYIAGVWDSGSGHYHTSKKKLAYNISAGASYDLTDRFALDLGLRYIDYGSFSDSYGNKYKTKSKEVSFGMRYSF